MPAIRVRDDLGRELVFMHPPERIVSLVPSDTYSLFAIGAGPRVVGRTEWCVLPAAAAPIAVVGGTKSIDVDAVVALAPHLVVANQEENTRPALEALAARGVPVMVSLPRRVGDGIAHVAKLARILGAGAPDAAEVVRRGYELTRRADAERADPTSATAFVPIWMDPLMTLNADTYGSDVLELAGLRNVFGDRQRLYPLAADLGKGEAIEATGRDLRYPRVTAAEVAARKPAVIVLPDEPYAFTAADAEALQALAPAADVVRVSGKDLFWSGAWAIEGLPRLRRAFADRLD